MNKYVAESFYTCLFKISHKLNEITNDSLKDLDKRDDGKFEIIDVKFNKRKTKAIGDIKTTDQKVKSVKYSILYMKAVKALQEAMARIETLEAKVKALEEA